MPGEREPQADLLADVDAMAEAAHGAFEGALACRGIHRERRAMALSRLMPT